MLIKSRQILVLILRPVLRLIFVKSVTVIFENIVYICFKKNDLPGHAILAQVKVSFKDPVHERPPFAGAGLSHCLTLVRDPESQLTSHDDQSLQSVQLPSIKTNMCLYKLKQICLCHS